MESSPLTFWNSGIWLIPLVLAATIAGVYLLARRLRQRTTATLKEIRRSLRARASRRRLINSQVAMHSHTDEEPYRTPMSTLMEQLKIYDQQVGEEERKFIAIQEDIRRIAGSPGLALFGAPVFWYQFHRRAQELAQTVQALDPLLVDAESISDQINAIAWDVAVRFRRVGKQHIEDQRILDELIKRNVSGIGIDEALRQQEKVSEALRFIPEYFFNGDRDAVIEASKGEDGKDSVIAVHQVLTQVQPIQEALDKKTRSWEQDYVSALDQIERMMAQLTSLKSTLQSVQAQIDISAEKNTSGNLEVIAQNLQGTIPRLEIESLSSIVAEAKRIEAISQDLENQVVTAKVELEELKALLPSLTTNLQSLTLQFAGLATSTMRPIAWGRSRAALVNLTHQGNAIARGKQSRTPTQIHQDADNAKRVYRQIQELTSHCSQVSALHGEYQNLLHAPEFSDWQEWLKKALSTSSLAAQYSPENWVRSDSVPALEGELSSLGALLEALILDPNQPIEEDQLPQALDETRSLLQNFQFQRQRLGNIQAQLEDIQSVERIARDQLDRSAAAFTQASLLLKSNTFLSMSVGNDARRLQKELQNASDQLLQRDRGSVNKKARQVETLVQKASAAIDEWVRKLSEEINRQLKDLAATVSSLDAIASLDEPVIDRARSLLNAAPSYGSQDTAAFGNKTPSPQSPVDAILVELRRRCEFSEQLVASRNALEDFAGGILQNYETARSNRQVARDQIQEIADWTRSSRGWPPLSVSFLEERQELGILEDQWEGLKLQRFRGMALASQLSSLGAKYHALSERVQRSASRAAKDQEQVIDIENEIAEAMQQWQGQARTYASNQGTAQSIAAREIRELLSGTERELTDIRRSAQQGRRDFNQVLEALRLLSRKLNIALVMIDDEHSIDIHGREIRKR